MVVSFASVTQRSLPMRLIITVLLVAAPVRAFADEVLFAAARKGDVAAVRERLAAGADVNAKKALRCDCPLVRQRKGPPRDRPRVAQGQSRPKRQRYLLSGDANDMGAL